jgi:hypothetical protein
MPIIVDQYRERGNAFLQATHLLVDHAAEEMDREEFDAAKKALLHNDAETIHNRYVQMIAMVGSFDEGFALFWGYLKELILFIQAELRLDERVAFKVLCQAEQFAIWQNGRQSLVTESRMRGFMIRQIEEPMCPLTTDQKSEYLRIKHHDWPFWSFPFTSWQKHFLKQQADILAEDETSERGRDIPASLRSVPGLANYSLHILEIRRSDGALVSDACRFCAATPVAIAVEDASERHRLTKQNMMQIFDEPLKVLGERFLTRWQPVITPGQVLEVPVLIQSLLSPTWLDTIFGFMYPQHNESRMIVEKEAAIDKVREKLIGQRSMIEIRQAETNYRLNPLLLSSNYPINFLRHETLLIKSRTTQNMQNGLILVQCVQAFIDNIVLPKLMVDKSEKDEESSVYHTKLFTHFSKHTLQKLINNNSLFLGLTTIPLYGGKLKQFKQECNICLNALNVKRLLRTHSAAATFVQLRLTALQLHELKLMLNALKDYVVLYNTTRKWIHHKELFLSGLEEIIVENLGGISFSASKDSRDRKGMQTLHTDAMLIYQQHYGALPIYNDLATNRRRFVEIFVDLFFSEHQQKHAGQNAPGSDGIKGLTVLPFVRGMYMLPADVIREIKRRDGMIIKQGARFAKLMQPKNPFRLMNRFLHLIKRTVGSVYQRDTLYG